MNHTTDKPARISETTISGVEVEQPTPSLYRKLVRLVQKHKNGMMACHFGLLAASCAIVAAAALLVRLDHRKGNSEVQFSAASIDTTAIYSGLSTLVWTIAALVCASPKLDRMNQRTWTAIGINQRRRFWFWLLAVNGTSLSMWSVITTLFWDVTWVCWIGKGEGADLNPFQNNVCDQLTNIWFYAIFNASAVLGNLYFVVEEQLANEQQQRDTSRTPTQKEAEAKDDMYFEEKAVQDV